MNKMKEPAKRFDKTKSALSRALGDGPRLRSLREQWTDELEGKSLYHGAPSRAPQKKAK